MTTATHPVGVASAVAAAKAAMDATPKRRGRPPGSTGHRAAASQISDGARTTAAVVLEVLAGIRGPSDAAQALGVSAMRYYQLEKRAVEGLVAGCEPRPIGRQPGPVNGERMQRECDRLKQDVARHQALLRSAQRALGVRPAPAMDAKPEPGKRAKRKPTVRALSIVHRLRSAAPPTASCSETQSLSMRSDQRGG